MELKLKLTAVCNSQYGSYFSSVEFADLRVKCFEPLRISDNSLISVLSGDFIAGSKSVETVIKTREDVAESLAKQLAILIVGAMEKDDTEDGYKKTNKVESKRFSTHDK